MKTKKLLMSTLTVLSVATMGLAPFAETGTTTALAKTKAAKVIKTTTYKSKRKVHARGGWMYASAKLTNKTHHMTNYLYTKFYATKQVKVRKTNGNTAKLMYIKSKDGKIKGYVPATYVWNQWGHGKFSIKQFRTHGLSYLNQERAEQGLYPLKASAKLDKVAQKNSKLFERTRLAGKAFTPQLKGVPHAGWLFDHYAAQKNNPILHVTNGGEWVQDEIYEFTHKQSALYTRSGVDGTPYLFSKTHTHVGFGGTQRGEETFTFILLSHNS